MISSKEEYKAKLIQYQSLGEELKRHDKAMRIIRNRSNVGNYDPKKRP